MIRLYEARRGTPTRGRGHPAPRRREGTLHRYVAISQGEYERATREQDSDSLSWEGPFSRQERAYEFIENEFGVPALVVDIGIDGAREWARVEAEPSRGDFGDWLDRQSAVMAGLLSQGTVVGRYDERTQQWEGYIRREGGGTREPRRNAPGGASREAPCRYIVIDTEGYDLAFRWDDRQAIDEYGNLEFFVWEGPFSRQEHAREFIENEMGVPGLVVDLGIDGAREYAAADREYSLFSQEQETVVAAILRRSDVLGQYDPYTQRWLDPPRSSTRRRR